MSKQNKLKNNLKSKNNTNILTEDNELGKLIKLVIIVSAVFIIFYGITTFVMKEDKTDYIEKTTAVGTIQYEEIVLNQLLNQNNNEYYVLVTDASDKNIDIYNSYLETYKSKEKSLKVYSANLSNVFNSKYISTESNTSITSINDLKLNGSTFIKVQNKSIVSVYEGKEKIVNFLIELIK